MEKLAPGDPLRMGPYRLVARLGAGGMGQVFLGRTAGGRTVAVKTVRSEYAADPEFRQRFRQEVAAARLVGGRWTAPVLDADTEGGQPWVATGYVAGPSLSAAVRRFGPLPPDAVRVLGAGLAEALGAVHGLGLVHRDVKPSNVLLALDGPRLIDFGIARALDVTSVLTRSGYVVGSPGFMSPEQARGDVTGPAGDVFALGAVMAFAATGTAPFGEKDSAAVLLYRIVHEEPELGGIGGELRDLVRGCLEKDPGRRPAPAELRRRLDGIGAEGTRLGERGWLPRSVSDAVARAAVELLDLEGESADTRAVPPVPADPPTAMTAPLPPPAATVPHPAPGGFGPPGPPHSGGHASAPPYAHGPASVAPPGPYPYAGARPAAPRRWVGRLLALVVIGVVTAALAGLVAWQVAGGGSRDRADGRSGGSAGSPAANPSPPTTAASSSNSSSSSSSGGGGASGAGAVPNAFVGVFAGKVNSPAGVSMAVRVTLVQGVVGDPITTTETDGGTGTGKVVCTGEATLVSATDTRLVLKPVPLSGISGCTQLPGYSIVTLNADGSLHVTQDGLSGDLTRRN
ncbi:serine/threonine-protein kinase [Streptomyces lavendulae]|uniref:serine/threonine-protein kinase n=1 Tax=Streptomyces lavendulae TaxID=1914 RepID=UPI0036737EBF